VKILIFDVTCYRYFEGRQPVIGATSSTMTQKECGSFSQFVTVAEKPPLSALAKGDKTIQTSLKVVAKALAGNTGTDHFVASDGGKLLNVGKIEWPKVDQLTLANGLDVGDEIFGLQDTLKSLGFRPEQ